MNIFDRFSLVDKVALVTGGARGLGYAMGEALVSAGANLVITDIDEEAGERAAVTLAERYEARVEAIATDVADESAVASMVAQVEHRFERIDVLINNAGISLIRPAEDCSYADWKHLIDIDLNAVYLVAQQVGRRMIAAGGGSIINIASMSGLIANVPQKQAAYNTAKGGVIMLTKSLAVEWAGYGIRVNAIAPGYMRTEITREFFEQGGETVDRWLSMTPMQRPGDPDELGPLALYLASEASSFATGGVFTVDGGYTAV